LPPCPPEDFKLDAASGHVNVNGVGQTLAYRTGRS
jgi:hypothetical protein